MAKIAMFQSRVILVVPRARENLFITLFSSTLNRIPMKKVMNTMVSQYI